MEGRQPLLELRGVALRDSLALGTTVFTSGLGGVFPRGIPIGTVARIGRDELGYERVYLIRPFVNPGVVSHVLILTAPRDSTFLPLPGGEGP
jgi:rod shape-determining protein MreC